MQNAKSFSVLIGRQIPPAPPLIKRGNFFGQHTITSPLSQRGNRGDLKTLIYKLIHNPPYHSNKNRHE